MPKVVCVTIRTFHSYSSNPFWRARQESHHGPVTTHSEDGGLRARDGPDVGLPATGLSFRIFKEPVGRGVWAILGAAL
jgi:hypothetical protein